MHNILLVIIVGILIFNYLFERLLDYLNFSNFNNELPEELKDVYDNDKYQKSLAYDKAKRRFGLVSETFSLAAMLMMLSLGGFAILDDLISNTTTGPVLQALLFFGTLFLASDILGLPFSLYYTFVLEEKYGFNRTTLKTFISDKIKQYILGGIIGGCLLSLFVLFYGWAGQYFWIYAWLTISLFMIFMSMFYASLILPLFNKLTPLPDGELRDAIEAYCKKADFKLITFS